MKEIIAEIGIAAPPEKVWQVLADFPAFSGETLSYNLPKVN